jgi:hypothetical protein
MATSSIGQSKNPLFNKALVSKALEKSTCYAILNLGYQSYVLPHKEAAQVLSLLSNIEFMDKGNYSNHSIKPISVDTRPGIELLSEKDYVRYKMAHILGIPSGQLNYDEEEPMPF